MAKAWHLTSRPQGLPTHDSFALRDLPDAPLEKDQLRVRNLWLSVDPYMRGRMNDAKSYAASFQIDQPMTGGAIGEVVESRMEGFVPGDLILHMAGWRDGGGVGRSAAGAADTRQFVAPRPARRAALKRPACVPQSWSLGRSLDARAHERREKLCRELSDRPADDRRRDRRGRRKPDGGLCARRPDPPYGRLARWRRDRARHDAEQAARSQIGRAHV